MNWQRYNCIHKLPVFKYDNDTVRSQAVRTRRLPLVHVPFISNLTSTETINSERVSLNHCKYDINFEPK